MKKIFTFFFIVVSGLGLQAQVATNFNTNDCNSINHDLFTELDAGKVVVICWVMPCSSCIFSAVNNSQIVQSFAVSDPGRVEYFLCDDTGNNSCSSTVTWANANGVVADAIFSDSLIDWTDYGIPAMPKTVVLGGTSHQVFLIADGDINTHDVTIAIQNALLTSIPDQNSSFSEINLFPNPVNPGTTILSYNLTQQADVCLDVYNAIGEKVKTSFIGTKTPGEHQTTLDLSTLSNGVYYIRLGTGETSKTIKFIVAE